MLMRRSTRVITSSSCARHAYKRLAPLFIFSATGRMCATMLMRRLGALDYLALLRQGGPHPRMLSDPKP